MYDRILVATDGSDHAVRATEHGAVLAEAFDATVHLLCVVDVDDAAGPFSAGGVDDDYVESLTEAGRSTVETTASAAGVEDLHPVVRTGDVAETILDYVDEEEIDIVAMGTQGRRGLHRLLTGSVAERVLRQSPVPVLSTRAVDAEAPTGYEEVLVPTDGSERAQAAAAHALAIADRFDSRVHAVSVVDTGDLAMGSDITLPQGLTQELETTAEEAVTSVRRDAEAAGLDAVTSVGVGRPKSALLSYVSDHDIDLVCMGTHGRTGLDRVLLGSTTEALVRRAEVPVLTVSPA
jgi:nucleotide-binding universal stress UspA family protein